MGCAICTENHNIEIEIKDIPNNKTVEREVPESLKSYLKQENKKLFKLELLRGHPI